MSNGKDGDSQSYDKFSMSKRVPKATPFGAQEGRPIPALRKYQAQYASVDWMEGLKLLNERKTGVRPIISGGLDDDDPGLSNNSDALPMAFRKQHIDPKIVDPNENASHTAVATPPLPPPPPPVEQGYGYQPPTEDRYDPFLPATDNIPNPKMLYATPVSEESKKRLEMESAAMAESLQKLNRYTKYLDNRVMVKFQVNGMTFGVPAVDIIVAQFGAVVLMPTVSDSITFTPPAGAETLVECSSPSVSFSGIYSGISFDLEVFGLVGMVFMKRPDMKQEGGQRPNPASHGSLSKFVDGLSEKD